MFCIQRNLWLPTEVVSETVFWGLVRSLQTAWLINEYRATGNAALKRKLPAFIFQATFDETLSKTGKPGTWRKQAATRLTGLVVMDIDHIENPQEVFEGWGETELRNQGVLLVYITPSGKGLKVVFKARKEWGNLIDNQHRMAELLGVTVDESCKDGSRMSFICREEDILFLDPELFTYENKEFAEQFNESYRAGKSGQTHPSPSLKGEGGHSADEKAPAMVSTPPPAGGGQGGGLFYHGIPYAKIVEAWIGEKTVEPGDRHRTSLLLADHLRYITDNDAGLIEKILRETPFVQEIINERDENVAQTVKSAQGYDFLKGIPRRMQNALKAAGVESPMANGQSSMVNGPDEQKGSVYAQLPLDDWAEELQDMAKSFPCMKELFMNVHPQKLAAVLFSAAAMLGTLMTRVWYHFWYEPAIVRRLNYSIFIIGDPGAGKNLMEKLKNMLMAPIKASDAELIAQVNRYKDSRTERTTSTKAQKGDALKRPVVPIRLHPARTATGEFIRHMTAAVETVQGKPMNLHMFSFDSELDNVTKNNKGGDWKDREVLELKAFHNEEDGQMYANIESVTGMFNVFWNFIYTGTSYALSRKVTQRNFGNGLPTRLAVIPMPDVGMAQRHQKVDTKALERLEEWAYRLDKVEGELPIEPLNDETYEWQSSHMEIADFNSDKAERMLVKRIPYYGIGVSLPFILMRHWNEWQQKRTLTMDDTDRRLCRLAMDIQYRCQHFFFGEMAHIYYEDQNKVFVTRKRTTRYQECYRKLPDQFNTKQFMEVFGCSQPTASRAIIRLHEDGVIKRVKQGYYKKVLQAIS